MTIIYQYRVATASLGGFLKLLCAWRGSVYKLLFKETLLFSGLYAVISLTYRFALSDQQKLHFEQVAMYCNSYTSFIPVSFVLGFYVTVVVQRWWQQFINVPWPDRTIFVMCTYLNGQEERARIMRRTVARYMLFGLILIMRAVSVAVMKRFPTMDHIIEAGFVTKEEAEAYEAVQCKYLKFWVPLMWANNIIARARHEARIETEFGLRMILEQLADFRDKCSICFVYDWITIPLVYTQVVTLAVYSFFAACLVGRQFLDTKHGYPGYEYDLYVPVFTLLQFFFYMGWLKVAEQMINPFGEDDDDYDINWLLDRHTAVAFALVDQCCGRHPPLVRDQFWNDVVMPELPYTEASYSSKRHNFLGSTFNIEPPSREEMQIHHEHEGLRRRSRSSFAGSLLSLFSLKPQNRLLSGSRDTLDSAEHHTGRFLSVPNGKTGYLPVSPVVTAMEKSCSVSIDLSDTSDGHANSSPVVETRERSSSFRMSKTENAEPKVRKLSSPSRFHFGSKKDKEMHSPKPTRFKVEPVDDPHPPPETSSTSATSSTGGTSSGVNTRMRRTGHILTNAQQLMSKASVSRAPILSIIEEGNTVTSLRQIFSARAPGDEEGDDTSSDDEPFESQPTVPLLEEITEVPVESGSPQNVIPMITVDEY